MKMPKKFLPQFDGYCAFGLGMEVEDGIGNNKPGKYPSSPKSFKIINEKLYFFHKSPVFDAKEIWNKKETKFLRNAKKE